MLLKIDTKKSIVHLTMATAFLCLQFSVCSLSLAADVEKSGLLSGKVTETKDKLIVEGATFVVNGESDVPIIKIDKNEKRQVILSNVRIISNNQTINDETGTGGIIAIDNSESKSKVSLRNVKLLARNSKVSSVSLAKDTCAGLVCNKQGKHDSARGVTAAAIGKTSISAVQGERPDYRKTASH